MFKIEYSPNLSWEISVPGSKNAALPIIAANECIGNKISLRNIPDIVDVHNMQKLTEIAMASSEERYDLTCELATKFRASILLISVWLLKFGKVKFIWETWWCKIWKRPLTTFDDAFKQAGIEIKHNKYKSYKIVWKPKHNIMLREFSVTTFEALITYLAFCWTNHEIQIFQVPTEPNVKDLIKFLQNCWAKIQMWIDHNVTIKPIKKPKITNHSHTIISDFLQAWTYFAIWAWAENSQITIKNFDVDELASVYCLSKKIWINFHIKNKKTVIVNSYNKKQYKATKLETRIYPWFPSDLQSIFGTLFTQCKGISKIFETLYEGRFNYLMELENLWAKIEILNPHQAIIIWPNNLKGSYVSSTDLRGGGAMILAWIMAKWKTYITKEDIILRWYDNIEQNLKSIWVNINKIK